MTYYKSKRLVDGKPPIWIIVDENGNIVNRNPSKDELKGLEKDKLKGQGFPGSGYYNSTNTCHKCGKQLTKKNALREKGTGKWLCKRCYSKNRNDMMYSYKNLIKSLRDRRTGSLDPKSSQAKGNNFEELTCIWRSDVSTIPVENLNEKLDCYNTPIDHSRDSELGIIQTKGKFYDSRNGLWNFGNLEREWKKEFDYEICYCASKDGKIIDRIYIIPFEKEIKGKRTGISIYNNDNCHWYDEYRIKDEDVIRKVNEIFTIITR